MDDRGVSVVLWVKKQAPGRKMAVVDASQNGNGGATRPR